MKQKLLVPTLCVLVATAVCAVAEMHPSALTARPVNDVAVGPKDPVPFQCDPCYYCGECLFSWSSTSSWNGDMAYDELRNCMWTVEVCNSTYGDGLEAWDYDNPCDLLYDCVGMSGICERGVAYDPVEDRLYEGGWNSSMITKVDPNTCQNVGYCDLVALGYPYYSVSGLAYDGNHGVIWVLTNSSPDWLFAIEPFPDGYAGTCTKALCYDGPMPWGCYSGTYKGGGLAYDITTNNLYAQNQANQWSGSYTECFDVGNCNNPTFQWGCLNTDGSGNPFFGWGIGKVDGADGWVTGINSSIVPPQTFYCQRFPMQPPCILEVLGYQNEVPPGERATLDLQVKVTNTTCEPVTDDMVFEFYREKGCTGSPIKTLIARDMTAVPGENCYIFAWGPVPNLAICNWYSVKVTFDAYDPPCEDCWDFHIGDPTPVISESIDF
jgi:hypothetical protein